MDVRYVSHEKKLLNAIISKINRQLKSNPEKVLADTVYQTKLKELLEVIYEYAGMELRVEDYLAANNLKSLDVLSLPEITADLIPNPDAFDIAVKKLAAISVSNQLSALNKKKLDSIRRKIDLTLLEMDKQKIMADYTQAMMAFGNALNLYITRNAVKMLNNESERRDDVIFIRTALMQHFGLPLANHSLKINMSQLHEWVMHFKNLPLHKQIISLMEFQHKIDARLRALKTTFWQSELRSLLKPQVAILNHVIVALKALYQQERLLKPSYALAREKNANNPLLNLPTELLENIIDKAGNPLTINLVSTRFRDLGMWKNKIHRDMHLDAEMIKTIKLPSESYQDLYERLKSVKCFMVVLQKKDQLFHPLHFLNKLLDKSDNEVVLVSDSLIDIRKLHSKLSMMNGLIYILEIALPKEYVEQHLDDINSIKPQIVVVHPLISNLSSEAVKFVNDSFVSNKKSPSPKV